MADEKLYTQCKRFGTLNPVHWASPMHHSLSDLIP